LIPRKLPLFSQDHNQSWRLNDLGQIEETEQRPWGQVPRCPEIRSDVLGAPLGRGLRPRLNVVGLQVAADTRRLPTGGPVLAAGPLRCQIGGHLH
jgi:hypothetical protein